MIHCIHSHIQSWNWHAQAYEKKLDGAEPEAPVPVNTRSNVHVTKAVVTLKGDVNSLPEDAKTRVVQEVAAQAEVIPDQVRDVRFTAGLTPPQLISLRVLSW